MWVYYFSFAISILLVKMFSEKRMKNGILYVRCKRFSDLLMAMLPIFFVFLFRWGVGVDANWYIGSYPKMYILMTQNIKLEYNVEPFFLLIEKVFCYLNIPYFWWVFFLGIIYMYAICRFIYDWATNAPLAVFLFFVTDLFFIGFGALRQVLSLSFVLLAYCEYYLNGKFKITKKICLLLILAVLSHSSGVLGVILICCGAIKFTKRMIVNLTVGTVIASPFTRILLEKLLALTKYGQKYTGTSYADDQSAITYMLLSLIILVFSIFFYERILYENPQNYIWVNASLLFFFLMVNSSSLIQTFRIVYYFMPATLVLVCTMVSVLKKVKIRLLSVGMIVVASVLIFWNAYYRHENKESFVPYSTVFSYIDFMYEN